MTLIEQVKNRSIELRKNKSGLASFSTYILSEIEKVGKNDGNRQTTDDEAISAIKKMIDRNKSNIAIAKDGYVVLKLEAENDLLRSFLPEMASKEEVENFLRKEFGLEIPLNKGIAMSAIKKKFGSLVDMKEASQIVTDVYGL